MQDGGGTGPGREWRTSFDAVPFPVLELDDVQRVRWGNRAAVQLADVALDGEGAPDLSDLGTRQPWRAMLDLLTHSPGAPLQEIFVQESSRYWKVSLNRVKERPAAWLALAQDVSSEMSLRQRVKREERVTEMGLLVAGIAHEVRNPLASILACLDAWRDEESEESEYRVRIRRDVERLSGFMHDLLHYTRPSPVAMGPVPIREAWNRVRDTLEAAAGSGGVALESSGLANLVVRGDAGRLGQALGNVVLNAIQHTPSGGRVDVAWSQRDLQVICSVEDTGPGFPVADLARVFEPFHTRRRGGTGLGLALSRRFVEDMGGSIVASNGPRGGLVRLQLSAWPGGVVLP